MSFGHVFGVFELALRQLEGDADFGRGHVTQTQVAQRAPSRIGGMVAIRSGHLEVGVAAQEVALHGMPEIAHQVDQRGTQGGRVSRLHAVQQVGFGG